MASSAVPPPVCIDAVPAPAAMYGFNTCTFVSDFRNSISTVDINNTNGPSSTYQWWVAQIYGTGVVPASKLTNANNALKIAQGAGGSSAANWPSISTVLWGLIGISAISGNGSTVSVTTLQPHFFSPGSSININGFDLTQYNGVKTVASTPDTTHFTFSSSATGNPSVFGVCALLTAPQGRIFANGWYRRIVFAFDETLSGSNTVGFPSFWGQQLNLGGETVELDTFDCLPSVGSVGLQFFVHNWQNPTNGHDNSQVGIPSRASMGNPVLNGINYYAVDSLWVPTTKNGGTGIFQTYFQNGPTLYHVSDLDMTYSLTGQATSATGNPSTPVNYNGVYSVIESAGMPIYITAGNTPGPGDWPLYIAYVIMWQSQLSDVVVL